MKHKWFFGLAFVLILLIVMMFLFQKTVIEPTKQNEELKQNITDLEKQLEEKEKNEMNQTNSSSTPNYQEAGTVNWITLLLIGIVIALLFALIISKKRDSSLKKRHEIIEFVREYALEKDGIQVFDLVAYAQGVYKDHKFPVALTLFCVIDTWHRNSDPKYWTEPYPTHIFGYLVDRKDPENVYMEFRNMSVKEVFSQIKNVTWGMEWMHLVDYEIKEPLFEAQKELFKEQEGIKGEAKKLALANKMAGEL